MVNIFKLLTLAALATAFFGSAVSVQSAEYPKPGAACTTLATQGCWTWYHDSRAVYYKGTHEKTYVGYAHLFFERLTVSFFFLLFGGHISHWFLSPIRFRRPCSKMEFRFGRSISVLRYFWVD